jgi:hypothetical protein
MMRFLRLSLLLLTLPLAMMSPVFAQEPVISQGQPTEIEMTAEEVADRLLDYAATFLGTPYRYGANGPKRFDCTGYTRYVFKHFGYDQLKRSAKDQSKDGREVDVSDFHNLQKGDLLLVGSRHNPKVVGHVGIFVRLDTLRNDLIFIHAAKQGVIYSHMFAESYYAQRFLGARRVLPDFVDYNVEFDSTASYAFNPDEGVHIAPDSLILSDADRRIVLFENGKWAYVAADGTLSIPENSGRIILAGDGNWAPAREAKVVIPATALLPDPKDLEPDTTPTQKPAAKPAVTPKDTSQKAVASADTTGQAAQPEKVYHTVVKGDSLYRIAKKYGTTVDKICQLNGITSSTILKVGRKLRVK